MRRLCVGLALLITLSACTGGSTSPAPTPSPSPTPIAEALARSGVQRAIADASRAPAAAAAINAFGVDLYRRLAAAGDGNLVFSAASIELALAMARAGAHRQTATQMDAVMHGVGTSDLADALNALDELLVSRSGTFRDSQGKDQPVSLRIANSPWAQQHEAWKPAFLDTLAKNFGAGVRLVDYKSNFEAARQQINAWVSDQTEQRIPELLAQGVLDEMTRLALVNAIYLKAPWLGPFEPAATQPGPFTVAAGKTIQVPMMRAGARLLPYAEGAGWRAVELPYVGGSLAMDVIVPDDLTKFEQGLDATGLAAITAALTRNEVILSLPKWDIETKTELADQLGAMGMPLAFDPNKADFSGMTDQEPLFIAKVIHQANITVDEAGTEAAAATAVVMDTAAAPGHIVTLNVDRPFLFAVRDVPSGAILFMGRVTDPSAG